MRRCDAPPDALKRPNQALLYGQWPEKLRRLYELVQVMASLVVV